MDKTITEEQLAEWAVHQEWVLENNDILGHGRIHHMLKELFKEVRRQREEIAKLKGETMFGHGREVAGLERYR